MKLKALCTIHYNGERFSPGDVFTADDAEGATLIKREFAAEHVEAEATKATGKKADAEAAAKAKADAEAEAEKSKADAAAKTNGN